MHRMLDDCMLDDSMLDDKLSPVFIKRKANRNVKKTERLICCAIQSSDASVFDSSKRCKFFIKEKLSIYIIYETYPKT
jgi:hypothetical protein